MGDQGDEALPALIARYKQNHDLQLVVRILEQVEGPECSVSRTAFAFLKDEQKKADFIQDLFLKMAEKLKTADIHQNPRGFILTAVRNELINLVKSKGERVQQAMSGLCDLIESLHPQTSWRDTLDWDLLQGVLQHTLNKEQFEIIEKMYVEGYTMEETGKQLGLSTNQVRGKVQRAKEKLREQLRGWSGADSDS